MARIVEGQVDRLACQACRLSFPLFIFSGDTDMATSGLVSASSAVANEIVLGEASAEEWRDQSGATFAVRANRDLSRCDLRAVRLLAVEEQYRGGDVSFAWFRRHYKPPVLVYACPYCEGGSAKVRESLGPRAFKRRGGILTLLDGLRLRD